MSVMGTGAAAGVAQTAMQAQQVAGQRDKREAQGKADAQRMRDLLEVHFLALEEGDESLDLAKLRIDSQVPEHAGGNPREQRPGDQHEAREDAAEGEAAPEQQEHRPDGSLYRHLDVRA